MSRADYRGSLLLAATFAIAAGGQVAEGTRTFDVASIRPNRSGANRSAITRDGGRLTIENESLRGIISFAYEIPEGRDYLLRGPDLLDAEKFDIAAAAPAGTSREHIREMLRSLLRERFHLRARYEEQRRGAYALTVDRDGPRLKASSTADGSFSYREGHVTVLGFSMAAFADRLSGALFRLDRPVVDRTGLTGIYDFTLDWASDLTVANGDPGPSLFTALQEQLGQKLEPVETTIQVLVVDDIDRTPSEN